MYCQAGYLKSGECVAHDVRCFQTLRGSVVGKHTGFALQSPCAVPCLQARCGTAPDVWMQLLRQLLRDVACRQAVLQRSTAAAAAPVELMLVQLAAELFGSQPGAGSRGRRLD